MEKQRYKDSIENGAWSMLSKMTPLAVLGKQTLEEQKQKQGPFGRELDTKMKIGSDLDQRGRVNCSLFSMLKL